MKQDEHCPKCGSQAFLTQYLSLLFSFERGGAASLLAAIVVVVAVLENLSVASTFAFAAVAALPVLVSLRRKELCTRCHIEFIPAERPERKTEV